MKIVAQRVKMSTVLAGKEIVGHIGRGLLVFLAVHKNDEEKNIHAAVKKTINLRVFSNVSDNADKMDRLIKDIGGSILVVSQFTLYANVKKGNRPGFADAAEPKKAKLYYKKFIDLLKAEGIDVQNGEFGAKMDIEIINDGPVTIIFET